MAIKMTETRQANMVTNDLCKMAENAYDEYSYGVAIQYYKNALKHDINNALLWNKLGICYIEFGLPEKAHNAFKKSINIAPNKYASNYFYVGQQSFGEHSLNAYLKGINILKNDLNKLSKDNNNKNKNKNINNINNDNSDDDDYDILYYIKNKICQGYVSIGELYMTDLCEEKDADIKCLKYLNDGISINERNVELNATLGEYYLVKKLKNKSIKYFKNSIEYLNINNDTVNDNNYMEIESYLKIIKLGIEFIMYQCT